MAKHNDCTRIRELLETPDGAQQPLVERHCAACTGCREYAQLQAWSRQVLIAGEVAAQAPLMSAVWASIHRASEQAWDSALSRSFRYLLPYMVAVVALILLVGGLTSTRTPSTAQTATTAFSVLNSPQEPTVAGVMTSSNMMSAPDPAQILGDARP